MKIIGKNQFDEEIIQLESGEYCYCPNCKMQVEQPDYLICPECEEDLEIKKIPLKESIRTEMVKEVNLEEERKKLRKKYKEKLQELLYDPEEEELLETRSILAEIYKDRTIVLKDHQHNDTVLVLDLTKFCMIRDCPKCLKKEPIYAFQSFKWIHFYCEGCNRYLFSLEEKV